MWSTVLWLLSASGRPDFLRDDLYPFPHDLRGLRESHPDTLVTVSPVLREPKEEVFSGDDQHLSPFQALIKFAGRDWQILEPEPQEEGAFASVHRVRTI